MNLAPIFAMHRTAQGGRHWEALGGIFQGGQNPQLEEFSIHPVYRTTTDPQGISETDFLYPLGYGRNDGQENFWRFFPLYWWKDHLNEKGEHDIDWILFPFFGGQSQSGERYFAFFPLFGELRDFLTFDRVRFLLFPLYSDTEKAGGRKSTNLLWPFFGWTHGGGHTGLRIFPLFSHSKREGKWDNYSILWPLIHFGWTELEEEEPGFHFLFFPFYGYSNAKHLKSWTIVPPFLFGHAKNEKTGYSSYDILWPLIKIVRGGNQAERTRVLPFFADFDGQEVKSRVYFWPFIWIREENGSHYRRNSKYVLPFWHEWWRKDDNGKENGYWQFWPFAHREWSNDQKTELAFPSPILFRHKIRGVDDNFWPLYTLYRQRTIEKNEFSSRSFADLYRREAGNGEDRISIPILFARRQLDNGSSEWSFLAGLFRFRKDSTGIGMMSPSFPGPGWD